METNLTPVNFSPDSSSGVQWRPALISSFEMVDTDRMVALWPKSIQHVEFYACAQSQLRQLFPGLHSDVPVLSAVRLMASFRGTEAATVFASNLRERFKGKDVIGFATYIPEFMSPCPEVFCQGRDALLFLIEAARYLRNPERPFTIELVSGAITEGVWQAMTRQGRHLAMRAGARNIAIRTLIERLATVARFANEGPLIQLAVELEPGPLFTISGRQSLTQFCNELDHSRDANLRRAVGLNLDIPHWAFLSQISVEWLSDPAQAAIRERIIHSHISDHGKGHFCDNVIGSFHSMDEFRHWTKLISRIASETRDSELPGYSGFISCEMEGCVDSASLLDSIEALRLLNKGQF